MVARFMRGDLAIPGGGTDIKQSGVRKGTHRTNFSRVQIMAIRGSLFVVLLLVTFVVADDAEDVITEKNKKLVKKCLDEGNATKEDFLAFANKDPYPATVKCVMKCFLTNNKAMKEDGSFDVETIVGYAGEARRAAITKCAAKPTATDLCDRAEEYELCFLDEETDFFRSVTKRILEAV